MTQEVTRDLVELSEAARASLTPSDWSRLHDLVERITAHEAPVAEQVPPKPQSNGVIVMGYIAAGPLVSQTLDLAYELKLVVPFAWPEWDEGRRLLGADGFDPARFSWAQTVGLLTALIRQDRFSEGVLADSFEDGRMPRLLSRLLDFAPECDESSSGV